MWGISRARAVSAVSRTPNPIRKLILAYLNSVFKYRLSATLRVYIQLDFGIYTGVRTQMHPLEIMLLYAIFYF